MGGLFRPLSPAEVTTFREWARENYEPYAPVQGIWHPVVQQECVVINLEQTDICVVCKAERGFPRHDRHGIYSGRACDGCVDSLPGQGEMWNYEPTEPIEPEDY